MADLSLGPLRIANPDDGSPEAPLQPQHSHPSEDTISPLRDDEARQIDYLGGGINYGTSPGVSPMYDEQYQNSSHGGGYMAEATRQTSASQRKQPVDRAHRQSIGQTYQDQQQSQFPQYPTMMPQNLHDPRSNSSRPGSTYYTQVPVSGPGNDAMRPNAYRMRSDPEEFPATRPRASSKRTIPTTAGVPSQEGSHTERSYRQGSYLQQAGPVPVRRMPPNMTSTRGMQSSPQSLSQSSGSPYAVEGGPPVSSEEWKDRGAAVSVQRSYDSNGQPIVKSVKKGVKDFNFGQTLGEGSYSTVLAATDRQTLIKYAIKVLDKRHIIKEKKVKYVNIEKDTLNRLTDHPGVVRLYYTFQDERSLYFVLDLCSGGELLGFLKQMTSFDEECTRFYGAQILDTIEYMHKQGIIHRDLKPENVLLDDKMHVKITDFGTAKMLNASKTANGRTVYEPETSLSEDRASSFVGTAEYVSPELLNDKSAGKSSDLWAFGCIIYQLLAGRPPFKAPTEWLTFNKIMALDYEFPRGFPEIAQDLVERLLVLDPSRRLTLEHIKNHPFFEGVQWGKTLWQKKAPRLKPYQPPPSAPIQLNGTPTNQGLSQENAHNTHPTILPPASQSKPKPRVITELPPPSQLDIEWSPVLTRSNERILKLGNLSVVSSPLPHSPGHEGGNKLTRLFGGNNTKKRQRLVMVTSSARIIIAAAGGEEKKSKHEIPLLSPGTEISSSTDTKGLTQWVVDTRDKHFVFEDIKPSPSDPAAATASTQEWLDVLDQAREYAKSQSSTNAVFSSDDALDMPESALSSHASSISAAGELNQASQGHALGQSVRSTLHKPQGDNESLKGRKRFSKRQSKSGLTAVF